MAVEVRPAAPGDADALRRVARRAWHAAHAPIVGAETVEEFLAEYYDESSLRSAIEDEGIIFEVAVDAADGDAEAADPADEDAAEDAPVGFASARPTDGDDDVFSLGRIYVHPDRWGEGIGRRLLATVEAKIERRGGDRVRLVVMADNDRAVGFYESAGYDRLDDFYDDRIGTRSYRYAKDL